MSIGSLESLGNLDECGITMIASDLQIGIIGLGYVGLPIAVELATIYPVCGFDTSSQRVAELLRNFDRTLECDETTLASSSLRLCSDINELSECNVYIVAVPTPITKNNEPDLASLEAACNSVGSVLKVNDVVVFESTVFPGCTSEYCAPILESVSGLRYTIDFECAYSPERINPGDKSRGFRDIKKVVAASSVESQQLIGSIYGQVVDAGIYFAISIEVAEAAKVFENTQRDINIALVNEFSAICSAMGLSTPHVLEAARTKWNFLDFRPGLVGGHCIGVDPYYLKYAAEKVGVEAKMITAGREVNNAVPERLMKLTRQHSRAHNLVWSDTRILVLGLTFKENCPDMRNSLAVKLTDCLASSGAAVTAWDPFLDVEISSAECIDPRVQNNGFDQQFDILILAVPHREIIDEFDQFLNLLSAEQGLILDVKGVFYKNSQNFSGKYLCL